MRIGDQVNEFLTNVVNDQVINVSVYKNQQFYKALKKRALEDIKEIFVQLHNQQLKSEDDNSEFFLKAIIGTKHPATGLTILDYCIIAGLYDIALRVTPLGCEHTIKLNHLQQQLAKFFDDEDRLPERIKKIQQTIEKIKELRKILLLTKPESRWQQYIKTLTGRNKYPLLLLITGISCIAASPFSGGLSAILLLSLGIPSTLASVSAFQSASNAQKNSEQIAEEGRVYYEAKELRDLIKLTQATLTPQLEHAVSADHTERETPTPLEENKSKRLFFLVKPKPQADNSKKKSNWLSYVLGY